MDKKKLAILLIIILIINMVAFGLGWIAPVPFWLVILAIFFVSRKFFGVKE